MHDASAGETPQGVVTECSSGLLWRTGGILFLLYLMSNVDRKIITLLVQPIERQLRIDDFQMSLLLGPAFALLYGLCGVPFGWAADRFSRRRIMAFGLGAWGIATVLSGRAMNFGQLAAARIGVGLGEATLTPCAHSTIADIAPRHKLAFAISAYNSATTVGAAAALIGGGWLFAHFTLQGGATLPLVGALQPWQIVFVLTGLPAVLLVPLIFLIPETGRKRIDAPVAPPPSWREVGGFARERARVLIAICLGGGGIVLMTQALDSWVPTLMHRQYGLSLARVGTLYGLVLFVVGTAGHFFVGATVDRMIRRGVRDAHLRFSIIALSVGVPCVLLSLVMTNVYAFLALIAVFYFVTFPTMGVCAAAVQFVTPRAMRGLVSSVFMLCINLIAISLGPLMVGFLSTYLFADKAQLAKALATMALIVGPLTILVLYQGMGRLRALRVEEA